MSTFLALLWLVASIVFIVFLVKGRKLSKSGQRDEGKQATKKAIIALAVSIVCLIGFGATSPTSSNVEADNNSGTQSAAESTESATSTTEATSSAEPLTIEIVAGEAGDYGKKIVFNEGTDQEDRTYEYLVPAGTYEVTNLGDHATQVNVYKADEKNKTSEGWEEWVTGDGGGSQLLKTDGTIEVIVPEGYAINVDEPSHISVKQAD